MTEGTEFVSDSMNEGGTNRHFDTGDGVHDMKPKHMIEFVEIRCIAEACSCTEVIASIRPEGK